MEAKGAGRARPPRVGCRPVSTARPCRSCSWCRMQTWRGAKAARLVLGVSTDALRLRRAERRNGRPEGRTECERADCSQRLEQPHTWKATRSWRPSGRWARSPELILGDNLDCDQVDATYDEGILTLSIPVAEGAKPCKAPRRFGGSCRWARCQISGPSNHPRRPRASWPSLQRRSEGQPPQLRRRPRSA
jgi:Hsp20/alpha crystallin family